MAATTGEKARLLDLVTSVLELVRDGQRKPDGVSRILQTIKDNPNFISQLFPLHAPVEIITSGNFHLQLLDWQRFFQEVRGVKVSLKHLRSIAIPQAKDEFSWLVIMLKDMTANQIYNSMSQRMKCGKYFDNLDAGNHDRISDHDYIIRVRPRVEADEEFKNFSANQIAQVGIKGMTTAERLQLEDFYHWKTRGYLDKENMTLCTGSRVPGGFVPDVNWHSDDDEVYVGWCGPGSAGGHIRVREAVS